MGISFAERGVRGRGGPRPGVCVKGAMSVRLGEGGLAIAICYATIGIAPP